MAMGPAFRVNHSVETFKNVDVYPLICNILGIEPAPNNGSMDIVQSLLKPKKERKLYELDNTFVVCKYMYQKIAKFSWAVYDQGQLSITYYNDILIN